MDIPTECLHVPQIQSAVDIWAFYKSYACRDACSTCISKQIQTTEWTTSPANTSIWLSWSLESL